MENRNKSQASFPEKLHKIYRTKHFHLKNIRRLIKKLLIKFAFGEICVVNEVS